MEEVEDADEVVDADEVEEHEELEPSQPDYQVSYKQLQQTGGSLDSKRYYDKEAIAERKYAEKFQKFGLDVRYNNIDKWWFRNPTIFAHYIMFKQRSKSGMKLDMQKYVNNTVSKLPKDDQVSIEDLVRYERLIKKSI